MSGGKNSGCPARQIACPSGWIPGASPILLLLLLLLNCSTPPSRTGRAAGGWPPGTPAPSALAALAPEGFTPLAPPLHFGNESHPLRDGNIFNYIDGGGVVYVEHGFTELFHAEYGDGRQTIITLDIYGFSTPEQVRQAMADESICPAGPTPLSFDSSGKSYRFPPDYFFYFARGRHLVYLHVNDDRSTVPLTRFGAVIKSILEKEES